MNIAEILRIAMMSSAASIRVALPGRVTGVKENGRVSVLPELRVMRPIATADADLDYSAEPVPELLDVPVVFPGTQAGALSFKLAAGDPGLIVFADFQLGAWLTAGALVNPAWADAHGASGAVFVPGLWPGDEGPAVVDAGLRLEDRAEGGASLDMAGGLAEFTAGGAAAFLALKADVDALQTRLASLETNFLGHGHLYVPGTLTAVPTDTPIGPLPGLDPVTGTTPATITGTTVLKSE